MRTVLCWLGGSILSPHTSVNVVQDRAHQVWEVNSRWTFRPREKDPDVKGKVDPQQI